MSRGIDVSGRGVVVDGEAIISGPSSTIIDDYERGDITPYSGRTSSYSVNTNGVIEGTYALSYDPDTGSDEKIYSEPGDGLQNYPEKGDTIAFYIQGDADTSRGTGEEPLVLVAANSDIDGYGLGIDYATNNLSIWRFENSPDDQNDGRTNLEYSSVSVADQTWYWGEIDTPDDSGYMEMRLYEVNGDGSRGSHKSTVTTTDTNVDPDNGGIGFVGRRRGTSDFPNYDYLRVI